MLLLSLIECCIILCNRRLQAAYLSANHGFPTFPFPILTAKSSWYPVQEYIVPLTRSRNTTVVAGVSVATTGTTETDFRPTKVEGNWQSAGFWLMRFKVSAIKVQVVETVFPETVVPVYLIVQDWVTSPVWLATTHAS